MLLLQDDEEEEEKRVEEVLEFESLMKAHVTSDLCQISQFNYYFGDHRSKWQQLFGINIYCAGAVHFGSAIK